MMTDIGPSPQATQTLAQKQEMMEDEDPLLISQSLTYITDDGSVLHSFHTASFSTSTYLSLLETHQVTRNLLRVVLR